MISHLKTYLTLVNILFVYMGLSQINETFDSGIFPPSSWMEYHTGIDELKDTTEKALSLPQSALFDDEFDVDTSWLVSPLITTVTSNTKLDFWQNEVYPSYYVYHGVWVSTNVQNPASGTFIELDSIAVGTEDVWENVTVDLSQFSGQTIYVAFMYVGDFADEWYLDNVSIGDVITQPCTVPLNFSSLLVGSDSVKLIWSPNGNEVNWSIEYGESGFVLGNGSLVNTTQPSYVVQGLQASTSYDFYITAYCNPTGVSPTSNPLVVTTTCNSSGQNVSSINESFEIVSLPNLPCSWTSVNSNADQVEWKTDSINAKSGNNSAIINYSNPNTPHNDWLFSPGISVTDTAHEYQLDFSYLSRSSSSFPEKMKVVAAKANDGSLIEQIFFEDTSILTANNFLSHTNTFKFQDVGTYYIGFHAFSNGDQWDLMIDDVKLSNLSVVSINELNKQPVIIFPNPAGDIIHVESTTKVTKIEVYTVSGKLINKVNVDNLKSIQYDASTLSKGVYFIKILQENSFVIKQIVKK